MDNFDCIHDGSFNRRTLIKSCSDTSSSFNNLFQKYKNITLLGISLSLAISLLIIGIIIEGIIPLLPSMASFVERFLLILLVYLWIRNNIFYYSFFIPNNLLTKIFTREKKKSYTNIFFVTYFNWLFIIFPCINKVKL